jgi:hypothetical protein
MLAAAANPQRHDIHGLRLRLLPRNPTCVQVEGGEFFVLRRVQRIERVADRLGLTSELEAH